MGSLANIAYAYQVRIWNMENHDEYWGSFQKIWHLAVQGYTAAKWLIDAWSWVFFAINTSLTASIMYKIMCVAPYSSVLYLLPIHV
jgi:hypothetical protein